jgi:hypothetical protein
MHFFSTQVFHLLFLALFSYVVLHDFEREMTPWMALLIYCVADLTVIELVQVSKIFKRALIMTNCTCNSSTRADNLLAPIISYLFAGM